MKKENHKIAFRLGISFDANDFHLVKQDSDEIIVDRYRESNEKSIKHALENDIQEDTLLDAKKQLLLLYNDNESISDYAHINLIYDNSIIPLAAYLSAIDKRFKEKKNKIEIILPFNFIFKSKSSFIFMAESETRFKFLYSRAECFSYFIEMYCFKNNIPIRFVKKNYFPFFFYPFIRRVAILLGKFLEDISQNTNIIADQSILDQSKKNIFLSRSNPVGFEHSKFFNANNAVCFLSESSSFKKKDILNIYNSNKKLYKLLPSVSFIKVIKSYFRLRKRINTHEYIHLLGINIPLNNINKEINLLKPNLEIYHQRLQKISINVKPRVFSKELYSPQSAIEYLYFSKFGLDIKFLQTVDLNHRIVPKIVFGGALIAYSNWHADRIKMNNPEITTDFVNKKYFKYIQHDSDSSEVVFFDSEMDELESRNIVKDKVFNYAKSSNKKFISYRHPRDKEIATRRGKSSNYKTLNEKICNASIIFTYPSAILNEILPYNIPIVLLYVGVGRDCKWHWSFDSSYPGCIVSLEQIDNINSKLIYESYQSYSESLFFKHGLSNE